MHVHASGGSEVRVYLRLIRTLGYAFPKTILVPNQARESDLYSLFGAPGRKLVKPENANIQTLLMDLPVLSLTDLHNLETRSSTS